MCCSLGCATLAQLRVRIFVLSIELIICQSSNQWNTWTHPKSQEKFTIELQRAADLSEVDFSACFNLIELTSASAYKKSKDGWKPRSKRKEMKLLDLKYLLVKKDDQVEGFASFMPTYEDDYAVVYLYEIHLSPSSLQA